VSTFVCPHCGETSDVPRNHCLNCNAEVKYVDLDELGVDLETLRSRQLPYIPNICPNCRAALGDIHGNFCPFCGSKARGVTEDTAAGEPHRRVDDPVEWPCYLLDPGRFEHTYVLEHPDSEARRLFVVGSDDVLPILEEPDETYYKVAAPGGHEGFVDRRTGRRLDFGIGDVENPLGYYAVDPRLLGWEGKKAIVDSVLVTTEPREDAEAIGAVNPQARLPIVEEREGWFKVQLPTGLRGWVPERYGFRLIRPDSLPIPEEPPEVEPLAFKVLGGVAKGVVKAAGVALFVGTTAASVAIGGYLEHERIKGAVSAGVRDAFD
jgi:hypothetical protein